MDDVRAVMDAAGSARAFFGSRLFSFSHPQHTTTMTSRCVAPCRGRALAREIADNTSAVSVAMTRAMMWRMLGADHPMEAHKIDSRAIYTLSRGKDAAEGIASFLEKRPPAYPGKVSEDMPDFYPWWDARGYE